MPCICRSASVPSALLGASDCATSSPEQVLFFCLLAPCTQSLPTALEQPASSFTSHFHGSFLLRIWNCAHGILALPTQPQKSQTTWEHCPPLRAASAEHGESTCPTLAPQRVVSWHLPKHIPPSRSRSFPTAASIVLAPLFLFNTDEWESAKGRSRLHCLFSANLVCLIVKPLIVWVEKLRVTCMKLSQGLHSSSVTRASVFCASPMCS